MDKWFRLDVLLVDNQADDGEGPHEELNRMLAQHPAVATFGMTSSTDGAIRYMKKRVVNTIFVNVRPVSSPWYWKEVNDFLRHMHDQAPNVLVVFYATKTDYNSFSKEYPYFKDKGYYFVEAGWISPYEENRTPVSQEDYQKFDRWHQRKYVRDVCISYASENKVVAEAVGKRLSENNKIFFGEQERGNFWGRDLNTELLSVFKTQCRCCLVLLSSAYLQKTYTQLELNAALERAQSTYKNDYLLIVKLDASNDQRISESISYVEYKTEADTEMIVNFLNQKLWRDNGILGFEDFRRDADRKNDLPEDFIDKN